MQIIMIPISQIRVHEEYATLFPPLTPTERESLKVSIQEAGIHDPLRVERQPTDIASAQPYVVLAGHHRLCIAQELNIPEVPCIVVTTSIDANCRTLSANKCRMRKSATAPS